ncbi:hypothetical protein I4F81_009734 [Pyropia yezoensis]|uniref:Uncharacterized protein n=1 Tax=Pyropia yezoensis TaxID=2788 RepID=A0ACC3CAM8_PYRYE|nr:hypothetical protein I4F81_009734 [Neopyropia yezoensis]
MPAAGAPSPALAATDQMTQDAAYALLDVASSPVSAVPNCSQTLTMSEPLVDSDAEKQSRNGLFGGPSSLPSAGRRATIAGLPSLASFGQMQAGEHDRVHAETAPLEQRATATTSPGESSGSLEHGIPTTASTLARISGLDARVSSLETFMKQSVSELRQGMEAHGASLEKVARAVGTLQSTTCKAEAETTKKNDDFDHDADGSSFGDMTVAVPGDGVIDEEDAQEAPSTRGDGNSTNPAAVAPDAPRHAAHTGTVGKTGIAKVQESVRARADSNMAGLRLMVAIRPVLQTAVNRRIGLAMVGQHAYPPPDMITDMTLVAVQSKRGGTIEDAQEFLLSDIRKPTKGKKFSAVPGKRLPTLKASVPLALVLPHTIENLKKRMVPAWFDYNGVDMLKMSDIDAVKWLIEDKYASSEDGGKGIGAAVKDGLLSLGSDHRIKDGGVGVGQLTECTTGHFNMAACFVRSYLELIVVDNRGRRRKGKDFGWYVRYRAEGMRSNRFLPTDDKPYRGMVLVDAADQNRMMFDDDETKAAQALLEAQDKYSKKLPELLKALQAAAVDQ